ncbi:DUF4232 domain-containing protein [Streptomyces sp. NPDC004783]|uniref:DUF4232 domain-containing protein n=1 Tax=Streptomyces sp. NPDC004783 TaxID=3154459 RepID=UPI0033AC30F0
MRTTRPALVLTAVAASALLLTACGGGGGGGDDSGGGDHEDRGSAACRIGELDADIAPSPAPAAGDTGTVTVNLTNRGPACTLDGFPAVTLTAEGAPVEVPADRAASAQRLTLAEGGTASFTLTYVRGGAGHLAVRSAEFALPGDDATHRVPWSYGEVATEGGTPEATVGAFQRAGD